MSTSPPNGAPPPPPPSSAPLQPPSIPPLPEKPPVPLTGWVRALEHTGIPASWLRRPRLPSPKMMIFLSTVASISGAWYYDRQQCKLIRQEYIDKVKHLAEEPLAVWDKPRKVMVYASKWPGDEQYDRSLKWFKKHTRPILVAAAVDYEFQNGNQHGALMRSIADGIRTRRRIAAGIESPAAALSLPLPGPPQTDADRRRRELEGGSIIIGRQTFKEYMEGLRRGWSGSAIKLDDDEVLARILENDGHFDEPVVEGMSDDTPAPLPTPPAQLPIIFSPLQLKVPPPPPSPPTTPAPVLDAPPPTRIPEQPPLALVPYTSTLGFLNIPFMIVDFFNHRKDVRMGAEAAYRVIANETRAFDEPAVSFAAVPDSESEGDVPQTGDLGFATSTESYFRPSYNDIPKEVADARKSYYNALPKKLAVARELARGEREATKDETTFPPPTEVELRAERMKKEKKWRDELEAWELLKKGKGVAWDERFEGAFKVFVDGEVPPPPPPKEDEAVLERA